MGENDCGTVFRSDLKGIEDKCCGGKGKDEDDDVGTDVGNGVEETSMEGRTCLPIVELGTVCEPVTAGETTRLGLMVG